MELKNYGIGLIAILAVMHIAVIHKNEDLLKDVKAEEVLYQEDDGKSKAAPTPSYKYYGRGDFFTASPMKVSGEENDSVKNSEDEDDSFFEEDGQSEIDHSESPDEFFEETASESVEKAESEDSDESEDDWWMEEDSESNP